MSGNGQTEGHVWVPTLAIGGMALLLAAGFGFARIMERANRWVEGMLQLGSPVTKGMPEWVVWLVAGAGAFGISAVILSVPGNWRRVVLWLSAVVVTAGWAPVLVLASREPVVAVPVVAVFWSGLCAYVYASRHRMAVDG